MPETFDFEDGIGPVPPSRQSLGSGGWVADTAIVVETAYVWEDAKVFGNARVFDNAQVYDNAQVFGNLFICGEANVSSTKDIVIPARGQNYARGRGKLHVAAFFALPLKDLVGDLVSNFRYLHLEELIEAALEMESMTTKELWQETA